MTRPNDAPFEPDESQRQLIQLAEQENARALQTGHFAPAELVRRMQAEADVLSTEEAGAVQPAPIDFYITMGAALDSPVPFAVLRELIGTSFDNAKVYRRRPYLLAVERLVRARSRLEATLLVGGEIRAAFPEAELVDVSGLSRNLIAAMEEMARDGALAESEIEEALGRFSEAPGGAKPKVTSVAWIEARVLEVLDSPEVVHLRSDNGRIYAFNRSTPVWNGFEKVEEEQLFNCLVELRFGVVLRAERLVD